MLLRISATLLLLILIPFAPYWLFLGVLIICCIIVPVYIEGVIIALLYDSFFSATDGQLFGFRSVTLLITIIVIALVYVLRATFRKRT